MRQVLERLRAEFVEMPGLRVTVAEAQRLCGVEPTMCQAVLDALVDASFLYVKADGTYVRLTDADLARPRPAKASVFALRPSPITEARLKKTGTRG